MGWAFKHLAEILNIGLLTKGYMLFFKSSSFKNSDDDTEDAITKQLDALFEEIKAFEKEVSDKWDTEAK